MLFPALHNPFSHLQLLQSGPRAIAAPGPFKQLSKITRNPAATQDAPRCPSQAAYPVVR